MQELKPGASGHQLAEKDTDMLSFVCSLGFTPPDMLLLCIGEGGGQSVSISRVATGGVVMRRGLRALSRRSVWQSICSPAQSVSRGWNRTPQLSSSCPERRRLFSAACRDSPLWRVLRRCSQTSLGWLMSAARGGYLQGDLGERVRNRWRRVIREETRFTQTS